MGQKSVASLDIYIKRNNSNFKENFNVSLRKCSYLYRKSRYNIDPIDPIWSVRKLLLAVTGKSMLQHVLNGFGLYFPIRLLVKLSSIFELDQLDPVMD